MILFNLGTCIYDHCANAHRNCVRIRNTGLGGQSGALKGVNCVNFQNATPPLNIKLKLNHLDIQNPNDMLYQKCVLFKDQLFFRLRILGSKFSIFI